MKPECYVCPAWARWLPRGLGGAVLAAAATVGWRPELHGAAGWSGRLVVLVAALLALWIVRSAGEVRLRVEIAPGELGFALGRRRVALPFDEIEALRFDPPFGAPGSLLPALRIDDRRGRSWKVSGLIQGGRSFIATLLAAADREDLRSWSEARNLGASMARGPLYTVAGWVFAAALVGAAAIWRLT